jgi:hypothetical protein
MNPIEDLPSEVADLIERFEDEANVIRDKVSSEVQKIQEQADEEIQLIRNKCEQRIKLKGVALIDQIKPLQESYLRSGKLDEALAIREAIRGLRSGMMNARPDPGNLLNYQNKIGQQFLFEVTGAGDGPLWGTDLYTLDSRLAVAAVHAGILGIDQRGVVLVTIQDSSAVSSFESCERHGVFSYPWGPYPVSYRVSHP